MPNDAESLTSHTPDLGPASEHTQANDRCLAAILRMSGLRPTRQRLSLLKLIMQGPDRHFTIEDLHTEVSRCGLSLSLATVYNATRQFSNAGILRELPVDGTRIYYDTNTRDHQHYFLEEEQRLLDVPREVGEVTHTPSVPAGMAVRRVDVLIHLWRSTMNPALRHGRG